MDRKTFEEGLKSLSKLPEDPNFEQILERNRIYYEQSVAHDKESNAPKDPKPPLANTGLSRTSSPPLRYQTLNTMNIFSNTARLVIKILHPPPEVTLSQKFLVRHSLRSPTQPLTLSRPCSKIERISATSLKNLWHHQLVGRTPRETGTFKCPSKETQKMLKDRHLNCSTTPQELPPEFITKASDLTEHHDQYLLDTPLGSHPHPAHARKSPSATYLRQ